MKLLRLEGPREVPSAGVVFRSGLPAPVVRWLRSGTAFISSSIQVLGYSDVDGLWKHVDGVESTMRKEGGDLMDRTERLEAIGSRGEAIIIVRTWTPLASASCDGDQADGQELPTYRLATGERLFATDDVAAFDTRDKSRRFILR